MIMALTRAVCLLAVCMFFTGCGQGTLVEPTDDVEGSPDQVGQSDNTGSPNRTASAEKEVRPTEAESSGEQEGQASPDLPPQQTATSVPVDETLGAAVSSTSRPTGRPRVDPNAAAEPIFTRPRMIVQSGDVLDLTFDDLEFTIEIDADFERDMLTESIESLHGRKVILRGFILAASVFTQKGIKQFVLIRDTQECCFGPGAKIYHNVQVEMDEGATTDFTIRPVKAEGVIRIKPWFGPDGKCYSVYHLAARRVK